MTDFLTEFMVGRDAWEEKKPQKGYDIVLKVVIGAPVAVSRDWEME